MQHQKPGLSNPYPSQSCSVVELYVRKAVSGPRPVAVDLLESKLFEHDRVFVNPAVLADLSVAEFQNVTCSD